MWAIKGKLIHCHGESNNPKEAEETFPGFTQIILG